MNIVYICTVLIIRMLIMKNKFASFINTMLVLLPISLVIVSCKKEEEDKQQDNAPSHVEAVDLGLSVKWANCNIGASTPEAVGAYYAWGIYPLDL